MSDEQVIELTDDDTGEHVTSSGLKLWTEDGQTHSEDPSGTQVSVDGDHYVTAVAVARLLHL